MRRPLRLHAICAAVAATMFTAACGGGGSTTTSGTPAIALSISPTNASVPQGGSVPVTGTLTRSGGFTGAVTVTVTGAPTDGSISATVGTPTGTGTMSSVIVTLGVSAFATPATYTLTVNAAGTGVTTATATFTLTVTAVTTYSMALTPAALSIAQGGNATSQVSFVRGSYSGAVTLSVAGAPTGVTASFAPAAPTGAQVSTLTLTVASSTPTGVYALTVHGTAPSLADQTAPLSLTVTAAGTFSISLKSTTLTFAQGFSADDSNFINRTNYSQPVLLTFGGAPTGMTITTTPATATTGNVIVIHIAAAANLPTGTDTITVTGTGSGDLRGSLTGSLMAPNPTAQIIITITPASNGSLTFDYSACSAASTPVWAGFMNGTTWSTVTGTGGMYSVSLTQSKGGFAAVTLDGSGNASLSIQYFLASEIGTGYKGCTVAPSNTITGSLTGLTAGESANLSFGGATTSVATNGNFQFMAVQSGIQTFTGYKQHTAGQLGINDRIYQWGGANIGNGGSLGSIDVGTWVTPATASMGVANAGTDNIYQYMYYVSPSCSAEGYFYGGISVPGPTFTAYGMPAAQQGATDLHRIGLFGTNSANSLTGYRLLYADTHLLSPLTLTLPSAYPAPTITNQTGAYARPMFSAMQPSDLNSGTTLFYSDQLTVHPSHSTTITGSLGFFGSSSLSLSAPDLSGLPSFNIAWQPTISASLSYSMTGYNTGYGNLGATGCADGNRAAYSSISGTH